VTVAHNIEGGAREINMRERGGELIRDIVLVLELYKGQDVN